MELLFGNRFGGHFFGGQFIAPVPPPAVPIALAAPQVPALAAPPAAVFPLHFVSDMGAAIERFRDYAAKNPRLLLADGLQHIFGADVPWSLERFFEATEWWDSLSEAARRAHLIAPRDAHHTWLGAVAAAPPVPIAPAPAAQPAAVAAPAAFPLHFASDMAAALERFREHGSKNPGLDLHLVFQHAFGPVLWTPDRFFEAYEQWNLLSADAQHDYLISPRDEEHTWDRVVGAAFERRRVLDLLEAVKREPDDGVLRPAKRVRAQSEGGDEQRPRKKRRGSGGVIIDVSEDDHEVIEID